MAANAQSAAIDNDLSWCSTGLGRRDAILAWQDWAARTIAPIDVDVFDTDGFSAAWSSHGVGQLRLLRLDAPAQRVVHRGSGAGQATPTIQLVYARKGVMRTRIGHSRFDIGPGSFVMLDNTRFYEMEMSAPHEAIDLMMPRAWLERWLPDPDAILARPIDARSGWAAPLGTLIETMAAGIDDSPLPRPMLAEQVGALLTLATGIAEAAPSRHRGQLVQRILRTIERDYADPELCPARVAADLGISKRYLQQLLAAGGTSFVHELTAIRLDRAADLLADRRAAGLAVGEIAWRAGFLDAGYFTRQFRRRFGVSPREWRVKGMN